MERIEQLLRESIGLNPASIGTKVIRRIIAQRMRTAGVNSLAAYAALIGKSPLELNELVEAALVAETWFFRDPPAILGFARMVKEKGLQEHASGVMRILSLACASGEEPYSLAKAFLDQGVPTDRFQIDGIDISERLLDKARARFMAPTGSVDRIADSGSAFHPGSIREISSQRPGRRERALLSRQPGG